MNNKRFYYIMTGVTGLLGVAIIGSVFVANQLLKQQSKKLLDLKLNSQVLNQQQVTLAQAKKDIAKYAELNREAKIIVPQDKDQAAAVREIVNIAKATGVGVSSIIFPASNLGNTKSSSSTSTTTPSTTTKAAPVSQTQQVVGLKGVYIMPITVQVSATPVPYSNFISFLGRLEQNRHTSQVSSVNIQPAISNPSLVNFTLIVNAYIKP